MSSAVVKAAFIEWLLKHDCKVEKIDPPIETSSWWVVINIKSQVEGRRFNTFGSGSTQIGAFRDAATKAGIYTLECQLFILEYLIEHLANRVIPAYEKRLKNGRRK